MKMVENYLSNLGAHLPEDMKQEVLDELSASIYGQLEDIAEQTGRDATEQEQAKVLEQLGHPMRVAASYLPNQQLLAPELFPMFKKTLLLTLSLILSIKLLSNLPTLMATEHFAGASFQLVLELAKEALTIIGVNTVIFYLIQTDKASIDKIYAWSPKDLKYIAAGLPVSRLNTLFEITVTLIFMAWWNSWLQWSNEIDVESFTGTIALSGEWADIFNQVNGLLVMIVAINLHKLWAARWDTFSRVANIVLNIFMALVIWKMIGFDNYVLVKITSGQGEALAKLANTINLTVKLTLWIILFTNLWEIFASGRKLVRR